MKRYSLGLISFVVGVLVGSVGAFLGGHRELAQLALDIEVGSAGYNRQTLEAFRKGDADQGLDLLEAALSLHVVAIDELLRELEPHSQKTAIKVLASIAEYRKRYPYESSEPTADENVAAILTRRTKP